MAKFKHNFAAVVFLFFISSFFNLKKKSISLRTSSRCQPGNICPVPLFIVFPPGRWHFWVVASRHSLALAARIVYQKAPNAKTRKLVVRNEPRGMLQSNRKCRTSEGGGEGCTITERNSPGDPVANVAGKLMECSLLPVLY